jgi:hypothetical protein
VRGGLRFNRSLFVAPRAGMVQSSLDVLMTLGLIAPQQQRRSAIPCVRTRRGDCAPAVSLPFPIGHVAVHTLRSLGRSRSESFLCRTNSTALRTRRYREPDAPAVAAAPLPPSTSVARIVTFAIRPRQLASGTKRCVRPLTGPECLSFCAALTDSALREPHARFARTRLTRAREVS